jgi:hypothetical protein
LPISPPPKDKNGFATPHDHHEILDHHRLIRGISHEHVYRDANGRPVRLSSAAFDLSSAEVDPYKGLSVDLEELMLAAGLDPAEQAATRNFAGSVALKVSSFRSRNFLVGYDPLPENPFHGGVWEDATRKSKMTRGTRKALLREASWLVQIDDIPITI